MTAKNISYKNQGIFGIRYDIFVCLFLTVSVLAVYWQIKDHDFVGFDDNLYITENPYVLKGLTSESIRWAFSFSEKDRTYWHPLTWLSHMLDVELYGMNPGRHHLVNLLLHIFNTLLLFSVFRKMTGEIWKSAFIASLFALHPLNVESVAWVAERKNVLSTFFWMSCMFSYVYYSEKQNFYRYLTVIFAFLAGLLAKPMLVTLPFVFLLLDYWPLKRFDFFHPDRKQRIIRLIFEKIPLIAISFIFVCMTVSSLQHNEISSLAKQFPLKLRMENALISYWVYIGKMLYPANLSIFYPHPASIPLWQSIGAGILLICTSYLFLRIMRHKPYAITGWLWYLGTLVPVLGITRAGRWPAVADRWTYIPLIGIYVLIAWGGYDLIKKWRCKKIVIASLTVLLLSALMIRSFFQVRYWADSFSLFSHEVEINPNNYVMHYNLGYMYNEDGKKDQAVFHYRQALRINPDDRDSHFNLGTIMAEEGEFDRAVFHFSEAIRIYPADMEAYNNMGVIMINQNRPDDAIGYFKIVLRYRPENSSFHNNMGIALAMKGETEMAVRHFRKALQINPDNLSAKMNLNKAEKLLPNER